MIIDAGITWNKTVIIRVVLGSLDTYDATLLVNAENGFNIGIKMIAPTTFIAR